MIAKDSLIVDQPAPVSCDWLSFRSMTPNLACVDTTSPDRAIQLMLQSHTKSVLLPVVQ